MPSAVNDPFPHPDLDELVQALNQASDPPRLGDAVETSQAVADPEQKAGVAAPIRPSRLEMEPAEESLPLLSPGEGLRELLAEMARHDASDLHLIVGEPPVLRVHGKLRRMERDVLAAADLRDFFQGQLDASPGHQLAERGYADFSLSVAPTDSSEGALPWRFRVNLHRQGGELAAAVRSLPGEIPSLADLSLPASLHSLVDKAHGLVLLCGPTGSGKSTTLSALLGEINGGRKSHIVTIEDPVEYVHLPRKSIVEHVEVGRDARSFAEALRSSLRQDPDIILVGEMRDLETISAVLTAAETGHLVLSTLHSSDTTRAIHRIVDVFPAAQQQQIRHQLSQALSAVVAQQLIPRAQGGGRVPATEVLTATYPVRHHIRRQQLQKVYNEILLGRSSGMWTLESSLAALVEEGAILLEEAQLRANHPEELETLLRS